MAAFKAASERLDRAIDDAKKIACGIDTTTHDIDGAVGTDESVKPNEPTGLKNLKLSFKSEYTSIEDRMGNEVLIEPKDLNY